MNDPQPTGRPSKESPLAQASTAIDEALGTQARLIDALSDRLGPLLRPDLPEPVPNGKPEVSSLSEVVTRFNNLAKAVLGQNSRLDNLLGRLDL